MTQQPTNPESYDDGHQLRMGFLEHLVELRDRSLRVMIAIIIGTIVGFALTDTVLGILQTPFCDIVSTEEVTETGEVIQTGEDCRFQILDPAGNVIVYFRVSLLVGSILSIPYVTYQIMAFIVPGLTRKEQRLILMSIPAITGLFLVGVAFAWYILTPAALEFLNGFLSNRFYTEWTADGYLSFVTSLVFWMGVAFETPLVFFVLALLGIVTAEALAKNWRIAVVGSSIAAAFITPTIDPVNMFLVMGPLLALYVISIGLVFIGSRINGLGTSRKQ